MVTNRRKKSVKFRGSKTHGWGAMKKHRGKGNKGGAGMAGSGKRGDANKPSNWKNTKYFGKYGFKKKGLKESIKTVNISYLEYNSNNLLSKKLITEENNVFIVDISKLGYNKLLGSGKVTKKFRINAKYASKNAIERIKKAGGEVIIPKIKEEVKHSNKGEKGLKTREKQSFSVSKKSQISEKSKTFSKEEKKDVSV